MPSRLWVSVPLCFLLIFHGHSSLAQAQTPLRVGFAEAEITPDAGGPAPVWIAGYGHNRRATGVHDPLMVRAVVLGDGAGKIALVSIDVVGLQYPTVQQIRAKLPGYGYVMVSSTHNHEGPDTIGIWGPTPFQSGVNPKYLATVVERSADAVHQAEAAMVAARAYYGTAEDESLLGDSRLPKVYDGVLRAIRFERLDDGRPAGLLVQWNCHPESLGSKNTLLTADFPYATVAALRKQHQCPVAYFSGAVGGLMAPPDHTVKDAQGQMLHEGDFEYARVYGEMVATLAVKALASAQPLRLTPLAAFSRPIAIPLSNPIYKAARTLGVIQRQGRVWTGDFEHLGEPLSTASAQTALAVETEVAYLRLGELHVACIPGELYPELVYGKFQDPVDPGADFPQAPLETPVMKLLPGDKTLLFGLANDEIGYIIPKRQWDELPPYAYGRKTMQYGEINSCGPEVAPILMKALENRVRDAERK
ncbi:MAG: hypothetical protein WD176_10805 [Pirellulales bacterium]